MKNVFGGFLAPDGTSFDTPEETIAYWDSITQEAQEGIPMTPTCKDSKFYEQPDGSWKCTECCSYGTTLTITPINVE